MINIKNKITISFLLIIFYTSAFAQQKLTRQDYINKYSPCAVKEMHRSGVPASITLAQGCLESGNGNSQLSIMSNNHFGIKCHGWSGKGVRYNDDAPNECFRQYDTVEESYADHSNFLAANSRYASLFNLQITDYKGWAHGLKKAGYATDPKYAHKLIGIIEDSQLHRFDNMSPSDFKNGSSNQASQAELTMQTITSRKIPKGLNYINGCMAVYVQSGDSPKSISEKHDIGLRRLYKFNDFPKDHRIAFGDIIYLEKKQTKAHKDYKTHIVKAGESMLSISQKYGIQKSKLYELNRMEATDGIKVGQTLNLRKKLKKK